MATVRATPEEVWKTVTAPELVKQWPYGSDLKTDWQPGLEDQPTTGPVRYRKPLRMRNPRFTGIKKIAESN